ncbi:hypothetical protein E2C01_043192 [Portunus trituberculatus]|uniref:Uncharacterized protein n=1 Tax=Portunus trituberculatus TaxID=210409 RepID=A0A5B7FWM1_PORTR|nr:hypothetical protein [Portunus trituberculatus]
MVESDCTKSRLHQHKDTLTPSLPLKAPTLPERGFTGRRHASSATSGDLRGGPGRVRLKTMRRNNGKKRRISFAQTEM